jgi:hypothetical protein
MGTDEGPMTLRNATEVLFLTAMFYATGSLASADRFDALIWWRDATQQAADIIAFYAGPHNRAPGAGSALYKHVLLVCILLAAIWGFVARRWTGGWAREIAEVYRRAHQGELPSRDFLERSRGATVLGALATTYKVT